MAVPTAEEVLLSKGAEVVQGTISRFNKFHLKFQETIGFLCLCVRLLTPLLPRITPCHPPWIKRSVDAWFKYDLYIILYHLIPKNPKHAFVGHKEIMYAWVKWMFLPLPTSTHIIPRLCWSQHPGFLVIKTVEDLTNSFHLAFHICETKKKQPIRLTGAHHINKNIQPYTSPPSGCNQQIFVRSKRNTPGVHP